MLYHDRSYGILGGIDAGGRGIRIDSEAYPDAVTIYFIHVSAYSTWGTNPGIIFHQYYCKCVGAGMGLYPAGLKAMEELAKLQEERGVPEEKCHYASNEMCTFLILNISSLQLIPVNMIAYRTQYGSVNPAIIIAPAMIATAAGLLVSILYCKAKDKLI